MRYNELDILRFNKKWIEEDLTGCWVWLGSIKSGKNPYPLFWLNSVNNNVIASRFSYLIFNGKLEKGYDVHHTCRRMDCVNPEHLELLLKKEHQEKTWRDKTVCRKGHELTPENTYAIIDSRGYSIRQCRICRREYQRKYRKR